MFCLSRGDYSITYTIGSKFLLISVKSDVKLAGKRIGMFVVTSVVCITPWIYNVDVRQFYDSKNQTLVHNSDTIKQEVNF